MKRPTIRRSDHAPLSRQRIHECARDEADEALLTDMVLGGAA